MEPRLTVPTASLVISTAGSGFFIGGAGINPWLQSVGSNSPWNNVSADQLRGIEFVLPIGMVVRNITIQNQGLVVGSSVIAAIYDATGNLLIDSGKFNGNSAAVQTLALGTPVTLPAGVYRHIWAQHLGSGTLTSQSAFSVSCLANAAAGLLNSAAVRAFTAANVYSGTAMPSTLGALTKFGIGNIPTVLYEP